MEHGEPIPLTGAEESVEEAIERIVSETNIFIAAGDGHLDEVQSFVAAGVPGGVNAQDEWGYSPLHAACSYGWPEVSGWLLQNGADPNIRDIDGDTPLFACESPACGEQLLAAGARLAQQNTAGHCAYFFAAWEGREEMLAWFAEKYAVAGLPLPPVPEAAGDDEEFAGGDGMAVVDEGEQEEGGMGGGQLAAGALEGGAAVGGGGGGGGGSGGGGGGDAGGGAMGEEGA